MPANKNAVTRYYILDQLLANRYHHYSTEDLCRLVNEELEEREQHVSRRTIELDLHFWNMKVRLWLRLIITKLMMSVHERSRPSRKVAIVIKTLISRYSKRK